MAGMVFCFVEAACKSLYIRKICLCECRRIVTKCKIIRRAYAVCGIARRPGRMASAIGPACEIRSEMYQRRGGADA